MAAQPLPHPPDGDFQLLTADEASELIRMPRSSIYELARNGRIPFVKIDRRIRFVRKALIEWIVEEMSIPPRPPGPW